MKKPSSVVSTGLWIAGGLAGLYLFFGALLLADACLWETFWIPRHAPPPMKKILSVLYDPLFEYTVGMTLNWR